MYDYQEIFNRYGYPYKYWYVARVQNASTSLKDVDFFVVLTPQTKPNLRRDSILPVASLYIYIYTKN